MKKALVVMTIVLAAIVGAFGQKKVVVERNDPSKGVKDAFERLMESIRQVDAEKVMSAYEKSDRLLIFNNNGSATIGWDNVKGNIDATYPKIKNVTLDVTGLRVEMLGKTAAYVSCKWKQSQEFEGALETSAGRMTLVYKLIGKDWKVVHRHTSPELPAANRPVLPSERTGT